MLTRYLYKKEYVKDSLKRDIETQLNFDAVLFWADELVSSGFISELWETIWTSFYTYYAVKNPLMESYIERKQSLNDGHFDVLKNLFHREKYDVTSDCFNPPENKRGRKPKWVDEFTDDKDIKNVILSIADGNDDAACWHVKNSCSDMSLLYKCLVLFFKGSPDKNTLFSSHSKQNQLLCILSMIRMMRLSETQINLKKIYFILNDDERSFLKYIGGDLDTTGKKVPVYKLLNERRLFYEPEGFTGDILESKTLLCRTPLWRDRFAKFPLVDSDDDERENFYQEYGYESDDYCKRVMLNKIFN